MPFRRWFPIMQKGKAYELLGVREQQMCASKELGKSAFPGSLKCLMQHPNTTSPTGALKLWRGDNWGMSAVWDEEGTCGSDRASVGCLVACFHLPAAEPQALPLCSLLPSGSKGKHSSSVSKIVIDTLLWTKRRLCETLFPLRYTPASQSEC